MLHFENLGESIIYLSACEDVCAVIWQLRRKYVVYYDNLEEYMLLFWRRGRKYVLHLGNYGESMICILATLENTCYI